MDFNQFLDEFAQLIADKVVAAQQGRDWPAVEVKSVANKNNNVLHQELKGSILAAQERTYGSPQVPENNTANPVAQPEVVETATYGKNQKRVEELMKTNIRTLRRDMAKADHKTPDDYVDLSKEALVKEITSLEAIMNRTIQEEIALQESQVADEVPSDEDIEEEKVEDDEDADLTREEALTMDLADLKAIAVANDIEAISLKGLDVEAVVDLLFGSDEEESEEVELSEETIRGMSLKELQDLVAELNAEGYTIGYGPKIKQDDLATLIINKLTEGEDA